MTLPRSLGSCLTSAPFARRLRSWIAGRPNRFPFDEKERVTCPKAFKCCWSGPWRALVGTWVHILIEERLAL